MWSYSSIDIKRGRGAVLEKGDYVHLARRPPGWFLGGIKHFGKEPQLFLLVKVGEQLDVSVVSARSVVNVTKQNIESYPHMPEDLARAEARLRERLQELPVDEEAVEGQEAEDYTKGLERETEVPKPLVSNEREPTDSPPHQSKRKRDSEETECEPPPEDNDSVRSELKVRIDEERESVRGSQRKRNQPGKDSPISSHETDRIENVRPVRRSPRKGSTTLKDSPPENPKPPRKKKTHKKQPKNTSANRRKLVGRKRKPVPRYELRQTKDRKVAARVTEKTCIAAMQQELLELKEKESADHKAQQTELETLKALCQRMVDDSSRRESQLAQSIDHLAHSMTQRPQAAVEHTQTGQSEWQTSSPPTPKPPRPTDWQSLNTLTPFVPSQMAVTPASFPQVPPVVPFPVSSPMIPAPIPAFPAPSYYQPYQAYPTYAASPTQASLPVLGTPPLQTAPALDLLGMLTSLLRR